MEKKNWFEDLFINEAKAALSGNDSSSNKLIPVENATIEITTTEVTT